MKCDVDNFSHLAICLCNFLEELLKGRYKSFALICESISNGRNSCALYWIEFREGLN